MTTGSSCCLAAIIYWRRLRWRHVMRFNIKWRAAAIPQLAALLSAVGAGLLAQIRAHQPVGLAQFEVSGGAARSSDLHNSQVHKLLRLHRLHLHQNCSHARARRHRQHEMRGRIVNSKIGGPQAISILAPAAALSLTTLFAPAATCSQTQPHDSSSSWCHPQKSAHLLQASMSARNTGASKLNTLNSS